MKTPTCDQCESLRRERDLLLTQRNQMLKALLKATHPAKDVQMLKALLKATHPAKDVHRCGDCGRLWPCPEKTAGDCTCEEETTHPLCLECRLEVTDG